MHIYLRNGIALACGFAVLTLAGCGMASEESLAANAEEYDAAQGLESLFGTQLTNAEGAEVDVAALDGKKIGIYFSAQWCPPCRTFTPLLVDAYNELRASDKPFEIVFVSSDRSADAMLEYMREYNMDWLAVPFDAEERGALSQHYGVRGIPTFIVIDADGQTLSRDGRNQITRHGADAFERW